MNNRTVIVITGPTASGKTSLGVSLALALGTEVVSADSMQLYRGMDIGSAKPTREEMRGVPHHMIDVADPAEDYSVSRWVENAAACCDALLAGGKTPVIVGGTGLYIESLLSGRDFSAAPGDSGVREALGAEYDALAAVPDAAHLATPMMHEVERCRLALSRAQSGEAVALVCSGDAGVYGMASPVLELAEDYPDVDVEVIAGATAAQSGSAVLGAPLAHDFAVVSLSDLLTPWEVIERRLAAVASADFCICLYNPRSRKRADRLSRAAKIMLEWKAPDTLCGWVRNIGREGQQSGMCRLSELGEFDADMFTTVFVGNADTKRVGGRMVTPRGYREIPCER